MIYLFYDLLYLKSNYYMIYNNFFMKKYIFIIKIKNLINTTLRF